MTHKVHPKAFRIKGMENFNVRGFYSKKMSQYLEEDFLIKDFLRNKFSEAMVSNIEIEHSADNKEVKNPWLSAALVAQIAAQQIEKRMPFRQVLKRAMERVMQNREAKGIKIQVSGRLNGIEIARNEWLKQGRMPLGTIRADIDYAQSEAYCTYGVIGVKVWIYKGDKFA